MKEPQMNTDEHRFDEERLNAITEKVIGCVFRVANKLGCGFLEKVYENALAHELRKAGLYVEQQYRLIVRYDGVVVGDYVADLLVEGAVLLELKALKALEDVHYAQCINYLRATRLPICLLVNFGRPKVQIKRFKGAGAAEETIHE
jgi:GxxExxY protein